VLAILRLTSTAVSVIAVVAHAFGEVLELHVGALRYNSWLTARPGFPFINLA
jgi:hypothetical protein